MLDAAAPSRRFGNAGAQRLDIKLDLPAGSGSFPILALRESAHEQTGIGLATAGADVPRIDGLAGAAAPDSDTGLAQELSLRTAKPLAARAASKTHMMLSGVSMQRNHWTTDGKTWGNQVPVTATSASRVRCAAQYRCHRRPWSQSQLMRAMPCAGCGIATECRIWPRV